MFGQDGSPESTYIKRGLTPFGEYIPLRRLAEFISPLAKGVNNFIPGSQRVTHKVAGISVGPIICYEIILDDLVRDMATNSSALIVQTNSATFSGTAESAQQLAITRIRAVEHSRHILSVSTVGISAFIDNNGRVLSQTAENTQESLVGTLVSNGYRTFVNRIFS
jgi:apolipoprotein N-acyltransferase